MRKSMKRWLALALTAALTSALLLAGGVGASPEDPQPGEEFLFGDVNFDGRIDSTDARMILQYEVGLIDLTDTAIWAGNVNDDFSVDSTDARMVLQWEVGLITSFPAGETFLPVERQEPYQNEDPYLGNFAVPSSAAAGTPFTDIGDLTGTWVALAVENNPGLPYNVKLYIGSSDVISEGYELDAAANIISAILPAGIDLSELKLDFSFAAMTCDGQEVHAGTTSLDLREPRTVTAGGDTYTLIVETLNTGLPSIAVTTDDYVNVETKVYRNSTFYVGGGDPDVCDYAAEDTLIDPLTQIKVRGNSSTFSPKKSFSIKLDKKAKLLGMPSYNEWALVSNMEDKTLLRNVLAAWVGDLAEQEFVMHYRPVDLWQNGLYWGNYILAEKVEVDKNRVNITKPKDTAEEEGGPFSTNPADVGYLLEFDAHVVETNPGNNNFDLIRSMDPNEMASPNGRYCEKCRSSYTRSLLYGYYEMDNSHECPVCHGVLIDSAWTGYDLDGDEENGYEAYYDPMTDETFFPISSKWATIKKPATKNLTEAHIKYIYDKLRGAHRTLQEGNYSQISAVLDVQSFVKWYMVEELLNNTDNSMHSSVFMYIDVGGKFKLGPMWDFDRSTGNSDYWNDGPASTASINNLYKADWFDKLFKCSEARTMLKNEWAKLYPLVRNGVEAETVRLANMIRESAKVNFICWNERTGTDVLTTKQGKNPDYAFDKNKYPYLVYYWYHVDWLYDYIYVRAGRMDTTIKRL